MLGILSNSFQVATRQERWGGEDTAAPTDRKLQAHWREDRRERFAPKNISDQTAESARPKLFGW
ncbi:hypothetical protein [uncultured Shimia sp.]|uniref:hypothetical protein n=1 Tax=uncultured Shimia sp. TaxID=573152 RepID=UPI0025D6A3E0|nr:hypothetical protein [uncultured Shimia sp.]